MSTNSFNSMRQMIYSNLQLKDTGELLEIWTQNDREAWTDDAFDVIRKLLLERIGKLPKQGISISLPIGILQIFSGFFSFIVLQALAELIFLLMDIEHNTRRKKR